jgi:AraC family transcriptional regulator, regulatory protein of adaptative response / methylated-DNA-[protein]-cysteine methyltransferase
MTEKSARPIEAKPEICYALSLCSLGSILVAESEQGICAILLGDEPAELIHDLQRRFPHDRLIDGNPGLDELIFQVICLLEAPWRRLDLPLDLRGTPFQLRVWHALQEIPAGQTTTYAEIARRIGTPKAARAVGQACASNPLAVVIPCHRVVRTGGNLAGFHWGIERKRALLDLEASQLRAVRRTALSSDSTP